MALGRASEIEDDHVRTCSGGGIGRRCQIAGSRAAHLLDRFGVDLGEAEPGLVAAHVEQHLAPRIDGQRMAVGRPPVLVPADLGGGDDERAGLDRPGAHQHVPVRLAGRHGEGGGDAEDGRAVIAERRIKVGEAQIVADREAERAERRIDDDGAVAAAIGGRFAPAFAGRQIDVEQMDLVVAGADRRPHRRSRSRD